MFNFISVFQREEVVKCNELERDVTGLIQKDTRKKKYKDRAVVIEHFSRLLESKKISVRQFLSMMSNMDNKIAFGEHEFPALDIGDFEFETATEQERFEQILQKPNDAAPIPAKSSLKRKRTKKIVSDQDTPVLTRSKARKAQQQELSAVTSSIQLETAQPRKRSANEAALNDEIEEQSSHHVKRATGVDSDLYAVTELMSSSAELDRLQKKFDEIISGTVENDLMKQVHCIMGCGRSKGTVLIPCKHQPTCNQCYVLWRLFLAKKNKDVICPSCKNEVISTIVVCDD